jgi:hypothetical protein
MKWAEEATMKDEAEHRLLLIRAAAHSACAATLCTMPHLAVEVMVPSLDVADDGRVFVIDPETGRFRIGPLGLKVPPVALARELAEHPDTRAAWEVVR